MLDVSRYAVAAGEENYLVVQRSRVNNALSLQQPLTLVAIYLARAGVVGSVFAAALTQVGTVVMSPAVATQNIGVGPCRGETCGDMLEAMARTAPSKPNEAMARIAPRSLTAPVVKNKVSIDPS
jgi:hypothetical protein